MTAPIPLYRPEVALYAEAPSVARQLGVMQIENFQLRQGDTSQLSENGNVAGAWGRVWGTHSVQSQGGAVSPSFSGTLSGSQVGQDLFATTDADGQHDHLGLFVGFAHASGNVNGFAVGIPNAAVGRLAINAYTLGGYWNHIGANGWYTDTVVAGSSLSISPDSRDGVAVNTHGRMASASFETGMPWGIGQGLTIEPQAQVIWQHLSLDSLNDGVSDVSFSAVNGVTTRIGARLGGTYHAGGSTWQPFVRLNLLRAFGNDDRTIFDRTTTIATPTHQLTGQLDAGVAAKLSRRVSVYAAVIYAANLGGEHQRTVGGNIGVHLQW